MLIFLSQISYDELQKCVAENKEDFSEHINTVDSLLKQRLKVFIHYVYMSNLLISIACKLSFFFIY